MNPRNIGHFALERQLVEDWRSLLPIFAKIVIVRAELRYDTDYFHYTGLSDLFDLVEPGDRIPRYDILLDVTTNEVRAVLAPIQV